MQTSGRRAHWKPGKSTSAALPSFAAQAGMATATSNAANTILRISVAPALLDVGAFLLRICGTACLTSDASAAILLQTISSLCRNRLRLLLGWCQPHHALVVPQACPLQAVVVGRPGGHGHGASSAANTILRIIVLPKKSDAGSSDRRRSFQSRSWQALQLLRSRHLADPHERHDGDGSDVCDPHD